jgi:hypothetical protein
VAGGVLTKWTAPVFFYLTAVPLLWWRGRLRLLGGRRHLLSAGLAGGLCLAWVGAAVACEGWDVFATTVTNEALQRLSPAHAPNPYPWLGALLHPVKLLAFCLPGSAAALLAFRPGFAGLWDERGRRLLQALHCWAWPSLLFWCLPTEHRPRTSFPLVPAISGLAAMVVLAWQSGRLHWPLARLSPRATLGVVLAGWLIVKLAYVQWCEQRQANGGPLAAGSVLAAVVPVGQILYILGLKDEGVMFYYGRDVRRAAAPANLPRSSGPVYCVLTEKEWQRWDPARPAEALRLLYDGQGERIILVRVQG